MLKTCLNCGSEFNIPTAWVRKGGGKYCSRKCRDEHKHHDDGLSAHQRYYRRNHSVLRAKARQHYEENREKEKELAAKWRKENRELYLKLQRASDARPERKAKKAKAEKTEARKAVRKAWRMNNIEHHKDYHKQYEANYRKRRKELHNEKQLTDPQYRIRRALRANLKNAIKVGRKVGSAVNYLGCSVEELRLHLERQWAIGMSWNNFGRLNSTYDHWQIDHVRPLSSFDLTDPEQIALACHWTNLAPLWAIDNRRKGNRIDGGKEVSNALY